jgi:hypothetical protein
MSECFLCHTALEPVNEAELEGVDMCVDCCKNMETVIRDYISSSHGGFDLVLDIIKDEISTPESNLRTALKDVVREVISEK